MSLLGFLCAFVGIVLSMHGRATIPSCKHKVIQYKGHQIHLLTFPANGIHLTHALANNSAWGGETVLSIAQRSQATAAINASFFHGEDRDGLPAGALKSHGQWVSLPVKPRGAMGWTGTNVFFDRLKVEAYATTPKHSVQIHQLNKPLQPHEIGLYNEAYGRKTLTHGKRIEVAIQEDHITRIEENNNTNIPSSGSVLSIPIEAYHLLGTLYVGCPLSVKVTPVPQDGFTTTEDWEQTETIIGGAPLLITKGKKAPHIAREGLGDSFANTAHARTLVCQKPDKSWIWVIIDDTQNSDLKKMSVEELVIKLRQKGYTFSDIVNMPLKTARTNVLASADGPKGMTLDELAAYTLELGCEWALNLDGGRSTTLTLNNTVINTPTGDLCQQHKCLPRVSDALLLHIP